MVRGRQPQDQREPHQQQQAGQGGGHPDVVDPRRHRQPRITVPDRGHDRPVGQRVQRHQQQVVADGRADEPDRHGEGPGGHEPGGRVAGQAEAGEQGEQVQGTGAVPAQLASHARLAKVRLATHLVLCTPGLAGTITRAGYPWSRDRSAPFTRSASSESGSMICPADSTACRKEPPSCSESTSTSAGSLIPASRARSRSRTPVQAWLSVDQPSTQAIGRCAVCCSMASRSARLSRTGAGPPGPAWPRVSRQLAPVFSALTPTSAAVWLIWKPLGPSPRSCPCGASSAVRRSGPPSDWPAEVTSSSSEPAPAKASAPRREIVGAAGAGLTRSELPGGSGSVRAVPVRSSRSRPRERSALITVRLLRTVWTTKPAAKTQAP